MLNLKQENSMSVKPFSEIEAEFDLSKFERKWHGKKTKLSKNFWMLVCHYVALSTVIERYSEVKITFAYCSLFYRTSDAFNWIREHYVGEKTSEIKKVIDFEEVGRNHMKKLINARKRMLNIVREIPFSGKVSHELANYPKINIEEFDGIHPELISVSECISLFTESGAFVRDEKYVETLNFGLKSRLIIELNKAADAYVYSRLILDAIIQIKKQVERQYIFKTKIEVQGATEALDDALLFTPEIMDRTDKQIKLDLENLYCLKGDRELKSVQKAIKRQREKDSE